VPQELATVPEIAALVVVALGAACLVAGLVSIAGRWRRGSPLLRQQIGWFAAGLGVTLVASMLLVSGVVAAAVYAPAVAAMPVTIGIAVLQHRLYEVDLLVNRALLYVLLTGAVAGVYVLVVAGAGTMLDQRGAGWLPLAATAVVAVAFQPLREAIQGAVNRLTYGAWDEPHSLVRGLHVRLADASAPEQALPEVVAELCAALRLQALSVATEDGTVLASAGGPPGPDAVRLPLVHAGAAAPRPARAPPGARGPPRRPPHRRGRPPAAPGRRRARRPGRRARSRRAGRPAAGRPGPLAGAARPRP
jgi:hypothetical protein